MSLNNAALITVDEYLIYVAEDTDVSEQRRARVEQLINWASQEVETYLDRTMFSGSSASEVFDGYGLPHVNLQHDRYITNEAPIITDPTPKLLVRSSSTEWEYISNESYSYDTSLGIVYFTNGSYFTKGEKNYKVVYDYGYANEAALPDDLKAATSMITRHYETMSDRQGKSSETIGTQTYSYQNDIPRAATNILNRHKRNGF